MPCECSLCHAPPKCNPCHAQVNFSLALVEEGIYREASRDNYASYAFAAACSRAIFVTMCAGLVKSLRPFAHASRVAKPPKATDTAWVVFRDSSVFMGASALVWIMAFTWFSTIEALALLVEDDVNGWGAYIAYTTCAAVFLISVLVLAWRGSSAPKCCPGIKALGQIELLTFAAMPILLGLSLQTSYTTLVQILTTPEVSGIIFWSLGVFMLVLMWSVICFSAVCSAGAARRAPPRDVALEAAPSSRQPLPAGTVRSAR
jgi:hypothetical protein